MAADHQNVAALLAALSTALPQFSPNSYPLTPIPTAARPPGNQGAPQGYNGLPAGLGQQPPNIASPPSSMGYAMPQPSASGSLDLSGIKPSASGKVSLDDAVARAKARAAEMGIQQGYRGEQARKPLAIPPSIPSIPKNRKN